MDLFGASWTARCKLRLAEAKLLQRQERHAQELLGMTFVEWTASDWLELGAQVDSYALGRNTVD